MILTEDYVRKTIEEVAPLVEEESGLKCDVKDFKLKFKLISSPLASYNIKNHELRFSKYISCNGNCFYLILGHELMHHSQYHTFKDLQKREKEFISSKGLKDKLIWSNPFNSLIEGDATLVEMNLQEKYFKNAKAGEIRNLSYLYWRGMLCEKFNDGKDRKGINELYTAPVGELIKIFGENTIFL